MTAPITVTGGTGGIRANRDAIIALAGLHRRASAGLGPDGAALSLMGGEVGPFADGAGGALAAAVHAGDRLATAVRALHDAVDRLDELATKLTWAADGYPWGASVLDPAVRDRIDGLFGALDALGPLAGPTQLVSGHRPAPDRVVGQDPRTVDLGLGLVSPAKLGDLAAGHGDDGIGVAVPTGAEHGTEVAAPRDLPAVLAGLGDLDATGTAGGIDVRILTAPDGTRSVIVDITGTRVWRPGGRNVADLTTNERALVGRDTAYEQGVLAALRRAGVQPTEPVLLVGHSQGGLVAINAARRAATTGEFHVTHVITAGAPVGLTVGGVPRSVRVLALENTRDVVPHLDGADNPDRRNVTTVRGPHGDGSAGDSHALRSSYVPLAADVQASRSRSVRDFLDSGAGFFRAAHATQFTYRVERR